MPGEPLEPVGALLVLLDDQPTAIDADIMRPVIASLAARQAVVVMAKTRAVREHARSEIMGWAGQARGTA